MTTTATPHATPTAPARPWCPLSGAAHDAVVLTGRGLRRATREVDTLLLSVALPVLLMLMFVAVFGGAIGGSSGAYVDYVVPGVILLCAGYGAAQTAVSVASDVTDGFVRRLRSMPVTAGAILAAHVLTSLVRNAVATLAVVGVAWLLGFRPTASPGQWLAVVGLLGVFVLALSWVSVLVGLVAGGPEAASGFTFFVLFLPYISSAFVDPATMPAFLRGFAEHQPVTPVIETLRGLLLGGPTDRWGEAVVWWGGVLLVAVTAAALAFRRSRTR